MCLRTRVVFNDTLVIALFYHLQKRLRQPSTESQAFERLRKLRLRRSANIVNVANRVNELMRRGEEQP